MTDLTVHASEIPLAAIMGFAGLASQMIGPLFRCKKKMLIAQFCAACCYAVSYLLLGQMTATAICLTGATQTMLALLAGERPWLTRIGYAFLPVVLGFGAMTYSGVPTVLIVTACCLVMIGRMQSDPLRMRRIQLTAAPFGAAHDVLTAAWPCLIGAVLAFSIAAMAFRRELRIRCDAPVAMAVA